MTHQLAEAVTVHLVVDGVDYSGAYGPGDELPEPIADLLAAQGLLLDPDAQPEGYDSLNVTQLRAALASRGLPTTGNKAHLIGELRADDLARAAQASDAGTQGADDPQDPPGAPGVQDPNTNPETEI